jgi:hypothetical protein
LKAALMLSSFTIGPFSTSHTAAELVVASTPCKLNCACATASVAANQHRQIFSIAARHHRVDRNALDSSFAESRWQLGDDFIGFARGAGKHARNTLLRWRHDRQPIAPAALAVELVDGIEIVECFECCSPQCLPPSFGACLAHEPSDVVNALLGYRTYFVALAQTKRMRHQCDR